ncbi:acetyltransferase (GNAT) family protein [Tamaricihabitans halophyticus]|uniref:Acetyltransferase (GNAT) family protein n=1 Tax=Tamaricihabitans halophyticus TaxID=1262583 RepID=A0A4R2Q4K7_9PSEU|nr:GNAT family N-acetyltransferase [Tamaricihabitans halophyticus]TCP43399.1 acetyltransferase (GNAT) family protein [Tamaricihabitans halophyticus]
MTEADHAELRRLFRVAGEGSPTESLWGHPESEAAIYLEPYLELEPESLFVAVRDGALVGYLTGCVDGAKFPGEDKLMAQAIKDHRLILRRGPVRFFARAMADSLSAAIRRQPKSGELNDRRWPAHLHINVAPAARGTGAAEGLLAHWQRRLRELDSPGCYLQTLTENVRAVRFFSRMGFVPHGPTPPVPGLRYQGRRVHQQTMVWTP